MKTCYNYRLWCMTGAEAFDLPKNSTQSAVTFPTTGWRAPSGRDTWLYVPEVDGSVRLSDIVYGLGGSASEGSGRRWEVIWLACRVIEAKDTTKSKQMTHPKCTITVV